MASPQIADPQLHTLAAEGLSPTEIAKRLSLPRSTVRDRLKRFDLASLPPPTEDVSTQRVPPIYDDLLLTMMSDLTEIVTWWQERKTALLLARDAGRETKRTTFHIEQRWLDAIRRQADLDQLSITQVVNEAFRRYFERTELRLLLPAGDPGQPPTSRPDARGL